MTDQLTILCPITSRGCSSELAEQPIFHALLPSMDALQMWGGVRLILGYDDDDLLWSAAAARAEVKQPVEWVELPGGLGSITKIWNALERACGLYRYLLPANDDLAFETTPLTAMETLAARNGFGVVPFADHAFPDLPTFYVVGQVHFCVFGCLYPLPWPGAHQDSWIADVYRPWGASEIDPSIKCHNRIGVTGPRFEYGEAVRYKDFVMAGRKVVNEWLKKHPGVADVLANEKLLEASTLL